MLLREQERQVRIASDNHVAMSHLWMTPHTSGYRVSYRSSVPSINQMSDGRASWPKSLLARINYDMTIRARFGTTVCALVKAGLGIAVIDQFTVAHGGFPGVELLRIVESTKFETYIAVKRGAPLSLYIEHFIHCLRLEMQAGGLGRNGPSKVAVRVPKK